MDIVAFCIGGYAVYWYGLAVSLAAILAVFALYAAARYYGDDFGDYLNIMLLGLPLAFVLARLFYAALKYSMYENNLREILNIEGGGLSVYGALAAFVLVIWLYGSFRGRSVWRLLDVFAPAGILAMTVIQLGNFLFQSAVGRPVEYFRCVEYIEFAFRPRGFEGYEYFVPVALYQSVWLFIIFLAATAYLYRTSFTKLEGSVALASLVAVLFGRSVLGFFYLSSQGEVIGRIVPLVLLLAAGAAWHLRRRQLRARRYGFWR